MQGGGDQRTELLARLVDGAPVVMIVVDPVGTITFCSDACEPLFGYSPAELVGTNMLDHADLDWNPLAFESIGAALEADGLRRPMLFRIRHKDGSLHVVEVTANSQVDDPVVQGMAAYIRSWNEQMMLDEILEALAGDAPVEVKLEMFVATMGAETLEATGAVLYGREDDTFTLVIAAPGLDPRLAGDPTTTLELPAEIVRATPWARALATGTEQLVAVDDLLPALRDLATAAGYRRCWAYPVLRSDGEIEACLVMWRTSPNDIEESYLVSIRRLVRLTRLVLEQERARDQLRHSATHDTLTGLPNRAAFFEHFQDILDGAEEGPYVGVLYLDLDGFKPVNDSLGHGAGDEVLVAIAKRFGARVRSHDFIARIGGDEFAVVCNGVNRPDDLVDLGGRLAAAAREQVTIGEHTVQLGASVGVSVAPRHSCSIGALMDAADAALLEAKAHDTGGVRVAKPHV